MENDEFETVETPAAERADPPTTPEPGRDQPSSFEFDDWALI